MQKITPPVLASTSQIGDTHFAVTLSGLETSDHDFGGYSVDLVVTQALPKGSVLKILDVGCWYSDKEEARRRFESVAEQIRLARVQKNAVIGALKADETRRQKEIRLVEAGGR